jgi:lipoic acid synthetase
MDLRARWLGRVPYAEALDLQRGLFANAADNYLLLLEHPHTYTLGVRADVANVLVDPSSVGAELHQVDRGGDVTYHGPGQLVGYPILHVAGRRGGGMADTVAYVRSVEQLVIDVLADLGLPGAGRLERHPGVWIDADGSRPRKIAAVGVRLTRGRSMHGFALNVEPDLSMFGHIVPCGITDKGVTSMAAEGVAVTMQAVVDAVVARAAGLWGGGEVDRADVVWRRPTDDLDLSPFSRGAGAGEPIRPAPTSLPTPPAHATDGTSVRLLGRLAEAGVAGGVAIAERKPDWMRAKVRLGDDVARTRRTIRDLDLVTVCEEAGCPNLSECWSEGTATFMLCGERCTRACGFCLVDTRHPEALDPGEPERVAEAIAAMGLDYAVLTMVARDDLSDGGAAHVAATVGIIRDRCPGTRVEVLISDLGGSADALGLVLASGPDVVNHNVETVARLQRAVRPSAGYARSLALLARVKAAGSVTKSGIIVGMGETFDEVTQTLADLASVGVDIVTIGQYLRPTTHHLPVSQWWTPDDFEHWARIGEDRFGIARVESSPLTRSSHHAAAAHDAAMREIVGTR